MLTIKWTQPSGAINILETKTAIVIQPRTQSWDEYEKANPDAILKNTRGLVMYDGGTIYVESGDKHLYIVNENGKTVQTV